MKIFAIALTDGSGDGGYGVALKKEASTREDKSSAGHEISNITQSGNVSSMGGLACEDTAGGTSPMLNKANWSMVKGDKGGAYRQLDPTSPLEKNWKWEVTSVSTSRNRVCSEYTQVGLLMP
jgi:hypothetical protein